MIEVTPKPLSWQFLYDDLLAVWDDVSGAIDGITTALPRQMTARAEKLEAAQKEMRARIHAHVRMAAIRGIDAGGEGE